MTDKDILRACIAACASAKDGRGQWRQAVACADALDRLDTASQGNSARAALAARSFGAWLGKEAARVRALV